ncbi:MAG: hypothetical protein JWM11_4137, partial [Planctomycetaceae bacterium]|nr:hypothetical protein [Planctomycetaceae bacterium]
MPRIWPGLCDAFVWGVRLVENECGTTLRVVNRLADPSFQSFVDVLLPSLLLEAGPKSLHHFADWD